MERCCNGKIARTIGTIVGLFDTIFLSLIFFKSIHILREYGFNLLATSAVSCLGVLYGLHLICIATSWIGFARLQSSFIVPKLVLKATTVTGCYVLTLVLLYFCLTESELYGELIAKGFNTDYYHVKETVDEGAATAAGVTFALSIVQTGLFILLWYSYQDVREREIAELLQNFLKEEKKARAGRQTTFM